MVFKLTSFDKILEKHSSSASSPDQKPMADIHQNFSTAGFRSRDESSTGYHMVPQYEVIASFLLESCLKFETRFYRCPSTLANEYIDRQH